MLKIFKYMKHSVLSIVCILLLLFIQAMSDLSLPDYTSDIVNVGIQQGGVSDTAPQVIRKSQFDRLLLFMNEEQQTEAEQAYRLVDRESLSDEEYRDLVKTYPALADEALYLREVNGGEELEQLNDLFAKPIVAVSALTGTGEQAEAIRTQIARGTDSRAAGSGADAHRRAAVLPAGRHASGSPGRDGRSV